MLSRIFISLFVLVCSATSVLAPTSALCGEEEGAAGESANLNVKIGGYQFRDSEDFDQRLAHIWTQLFFTKNVYLSAEATHHLFTQDSSEFDGNGVDFVLGGTFGPLSDVKIGLGLAGYDSVEGNFSFLDVSYLGSFAFKPTETSHLTVGYNHLNVALDSKSLGALREQISSDEFNPSFYQWISESWSFWTGLRYGALSDDNTKMSVDASITYLLRPEPMFGFSSALGYISYENRSERYWDPDGYTTLSFIFLLQQPLGKYFSFEFKGSPGYSPSESQMSAWGSLLLDLHPSPKWSIQVNGYIMGNPARNGNYSATTLSADLMWAP